MQKSYIDHQKSRKIAGICGGLAEYFNLAPTFVLLAYVAICLLTAVGPGLLAYIIAWLIVPEK